MKASIVAVLITVAEIKDGEIFNRNGVKVLAFSVWHDDGNPAFGYRIEYKGRSVLLSGDTSYSKNVVRAGRGADLVPRRDRDGQARGEPVGDRAAHCRSVQVRPIHGKAFEPVFCAAPGRQSLNAEREAVASFRSMTATPIRSARQRRSDRRKRYSFMPIVAVRPARTQFPAVVALRGFEAVRPAREVPRKSGTEPRGAVRGEAKPAAVVQWSEAALGLARDAQAASSRLPAPGETDAEPSRTEPSRTEPSRTEPTASEPTASEPTPEESQEIQDLRRRDREVRAHEQAHKAAGGAHAGSIHLQYSVGPDGKRYASGGEVSIDVSPVRGEPEATLRKMEAVRRAANAPAEPSGADRQVAAQAASTANRARAELAAERYAKAQG